ncbi:MAG: hypothetical protein LBK52_02365 [Deltaproteobacteria bacterium]|jgi:hypothetical protein|nr:hypothetical protein [Deltaproteobacteria bacterium]
MTDRNKKTSQAGSPGRQESGRKAKTPNSSESGREAKTPNPPESGRKAKTPSPPESGQKAKSPNSSESGRKAKTPNPQESGWKGKSPSPSESGRKAKSSASPGRRTAAADIPPGILFRELPGRNYCKADGSPEPAPPDEVWVREEPLKNTAASVLEKIMEQIFDTPGCDLKLFTKKCDLRLREEMADLGYLVSQKELRRLMLGIGFAADYRLKRPNDTGIDAKDFLTYQIDCALLNSAPILLIETVKSERPDFYSPDSQPGRMLPEDGRHGQLLPEDIRPYGQGYSRRRLPVLMPYGVYEGRTEEEGPFVCSTDLDEGAFALASIRGWWFEEGAELYSSPSYLLLVPSGLKGQGYGNDLWVSELQKLSDDLSLPIHVCHRPVLKTDPLAEYPRKSLLSF